MIQLYMRGITIVKDVKGGSKPTCDWGAGVVACSWASDGSYRLIVANGS